MSTSICMSTSIGGTISMSSIGSISSSSIIISGNSSGNISGNISDSIQACPAHIPDSACGAPRPRRVRRAAASYDPSHEKNKKERETF
jgi:hypothetical protein